jgi:hyperosmotically inducible protein
MNSHRTAPATRRLFALAVLAAGLVSGTAQAATDTAASAPAGSTAVKKTERVVSDSWITTKVKSEIAASSLSRGFEVSVKTLHGNVALKGKLASQDAIDQVKAIAGKVKGVKDVDASGVSVVAG